MTSLLQFRHVYDPIIKAHEAAIPAMKYMLRIGHGYIASQEYMQAVRATAVTDIRNAWQFDRLNDANNVAEYLNEQPMYAGRPVTVVATR